MKILPGNTSLRIWTDHSPIYCISLGIELALGMIPKRVAGEKRLILLIKKERKTRSDKKVDVKPTVPIAIKMAIYDTAFILERPIKDVSESICKNAMESETIINYLSSYFRRNYLFGTTVKMGRLERITIDVPYDGDTGKITIKFVQRDYDKLCTLAYALDLTPTSTASLLLRIAYFNNMLKTLSK